MSKGAPAGPARDYLRPIEEAGVGEWICVHWSKEAYPDWRGARWRVACRLGEGLFVDLHGEDHKLPAPYGDSAYLPKPTHFIPLEDV